MSNHVLFSPMGEADTQQTESTHAYTHCLLHRNRHQNSHWSGRRPTETARETVLEEFSGVL